MFIEIGRIFSRPSYNWWQSKYSYLPPWGIFLYSHCINTKKQRRNGPPYVSAFVLKTWLKTQGHLSTVSSPCYRIRGLFIRWNESEVWLPVPTRTRDQDFIWGPKLANDGTFISTAPDKDQFPWAPGTTSQASTGNLLLPSFREKRQWQVLMCFGTCQHWV